MTGQEPRYGLGSSPGPDVIMAFNDKQATHLSMIFTAFALWICLSPHDMKHSAPLSLHIFAHHNGAQLRGTSRVSLTHPGPASQAGV